MSTNEKNRRNRFYDYYEHLEKFGFEWKDTDLTFKYNVDFHQTKKKKLIKRMTLGKDTRQKIFIDESRI